MVKEKIRELFNDKNKQNFFIYGIGQVFNLLSPLIVAPIVILKCLDSGYAKVGLGFAMALFLILIVDYAFDIKATKSASENRNDSKVLEKILSTTIFTKIFLFTTVFCFATTLILLVPFFHQEKSLLFLSLTIVLAQVFNPIWFLQGIENFKTISIVNIASKVTYVSLILLFVSQPDDYILVNLFLGISSFIFNLAGLIYIKRKYHFKIITPSFLEIKTILVADFTFCISQLFLSARQLSPFLLVSYFLGFSIAGQYRVIEQIVNLFRTFSQVFLKFFYAQACYKFIVDVNAGWKYWKKYTLMNVALISIGVLFLMSCSTFVLHYFNLTQESINELDFLFKIGLIISFLMSFSLPLEQLMFIQDKSKVYIKIAIFATIVNIVLILVLIKRFELLGIISTLIISELIFITFYFYNAFLHTKKIINNENHLT